MFDFISPRQATVWPTDPRKLPELIDFAVTRNVDGNLAFAEIRTDLFSDQSSVIIKLNEERVESQYPFRLATSRISWLIYKKYINSHIQT